MLCQLESIAVQVPLICFTNLVLTNQETKENLGLGWGKMAIQSSSLVNGLVEYLVFKEAFYTHITKYFLHKNLLRSIVYMYDK